MVRVPNRRTDVIDYLVDSRIALGSILVTALPTFVCAKTGQKILKGGPKDIFDGLL